MALMAAGVIPAPVTDTTRPGPCAPDCHTWTTKHRPERLVPEGHSHRDCELLRAEAASLCRLCETPIGYDVLMYVDPDDGDAFVHAACLEAQP